jgi:hypothetical protein
MITLKEFIELNEISRIGAKTFTGSGTLSNYDGTLFPKAKWLPGNAGLMYDITMKSHPIILLIDPYKKTGSKVIGELTLIRWEPFPMKNAYKVDTITVDTKYRGKGIAKALYGIVLSILHINLLSGISQTPGGRINWISLNRIPGCEVKGYISLPDKLFNSNTTPLKDALDSIMDLGTDYLGAKTYKGNKTHYFTFPVSEADNGELSMELETKIKLYSNFHEEHVKTGLVASWVG